VLRFGFCAGKHDVDPARGPPAVTIKGLVVDHQDRHRQQSSILAGLTQAEFCSIVDRRAASIGNALEEML
jgi:hypothetical protein